MQDKGENDEEKRKEKDYKSRTRRGQVKRKDTPKKGNKAKKEGHIMREQGHTKRLKPDRHCRDEVTKTEKKKAMRIQTGEHNDTTKGPQLCRFWERTKQMYEGLR